MALSEPLRITLLVARVLEQLEVPYLLGSSLASSLHGIHRGTQGSARHKLEGSSFSS